jgi:integrase
VADLRRDADPIRVSGAGGERLIDVKTAWKSLLHVAGVTGFRFHDLRHTFASRLGMAGVDLNTVQALLAHADLKMTLRYAHLAPEHKAAAVAELAPTAACPTDRVKSVQLATGRGRRWS